MLHRHNCQAQRSYNNPVAEHEGLSSRVAPMEFEGPRRDLALHPKSPLNR